MGENTEVQKVLDSLAALEARGGSAPPDLAQLRSLDLVGALTATRPPDADEIGEARAEGWLDLISTLAAPFEGLGPEHPMFFMVAQLGGPLRGVVNGLRRALQAPEPGQGAAGKRGKALQDLGVAAIDLTRGLSTAVGAFVAGRDVTAWALRARSAAEAAEAAEKAASGAAEASRKRLEDMAQQATRSAALARSINFENLAEEHRGASRRWLATAGILAIGLAALAAFFLFRWKPDSPQLAWVRLPSEILLFSVGAFVLAVTTKTFRVHKHLEEVYLQRVATVKTFLHFLEEARDEETRRAVFLEIAKAIYQPQAPGYLSGGGPEAPGPMAVAMLGELGALKTGKR